MLFYIESPTCNSCNGDNVLNCLTDSFINCHNSVINSSYSFHSAGGVDSYESPLQPPAPGSHGTSQKGKLVNGVVALSLVEAAENINSYFTPGTMAFPGHIASIDKAVCLTYPGGGSFAY